MAANPSLSIQFQIANPETDSLFLFTDTTDWAGMGIDPLNVNIAIKVYRPDGVLFYAGSHAPPDIAPSISVTNNLISVPTGADNKVIEGQYTIISEAVVTGPTEPGTWSTTYTPNLAYCRDLPTPVITWDISCIAGPIVSATNATSTGAWTVSSSTISIFAPPNATPPYNASYTSLGLSVNSGSDAVVTGLWTASFEMEIERDYGTHTVTYTLTQNPNNVDIPSASQSVVCMRLCQVRCCINKAYQRWRAAVEDGNSKESSALYTQWAMAVNLLWQAWFEAENCQDESNTNEYIALIQKILACTDDCDDCTGDLEGIITPISGSSTSYTFGTDTPSYMLVSESGGLVKYSLSTLSTTTLAAVKSYALAPSAGLSAAGFTILTVDTPTVPPLRSWTLGFAGDFPAAIQLYTERISLSFAGGAVLVTRTNQIVRGSILKIPVTMVAVGGSDVAWLSLPAVLNVGDFYTVAPAPADPIAYKMIVAPINADYAGAALAASSVGVTISVDGGTATGNSNNSAYATIRETASGLPLTWGALRTIFRSIDIEIIIHANA